jgi:RNA polymerase sigma-70 factor (ECF subfamily)
MAKAEDALLENLNAFVAFARKRVGDPEVAADLVQDSWLKALKSVNKPGDGEGAVTWFYREENPACGGATRAACQSVTITSSASWPQPRSS